MDNVQKNIMQVHELKGEKKLDEYIDERERILQKLRDKDVKNRKKSYIDHYPKSSNYSLKMFQKKTTLRIFADEAVADTNLKNKLINVVNPV